MNFQLTRESTMRERGRTRRGATHLSVLLCFLAGLTGCQNLTSPNENSGDLGELTGDPSRSNIAALAIGTVITTRADIGATVGGTATYLSLLGSLGRNALVIDVADPRFIQEVLTGQFTGSNDAFGGNVWDNPYKAIATAEILLNAVDAADPSALTSAEAEAVRGFAKIFEAYNLLLIVNTRDTNCGCPITIPEDVSQPAPAVSKEQVFARIVQLLDEADGHLANGGASFPFNLPSGFTTWGFDTPSEMRTFAKALRARVAVYMGDFSTALSALEASFLDTSESLDRGVYFPFSTQSGDDTNVYVARSSVFFAHESLETDAELKSDGSPDDRFERKTRPVPASSFAGLGSDLGFTVYESLSSPVPIIRNEELILLRAEANIGLGNLTAAQADINFIRETSGGLEPVTLTADNALDQLLYEKRYSLLFEGGHRWIDMRRYARLDEIPLQDSEIMHERFPIPTPEAQNRGQ